MNALAEWEKNTLRQRQDIITKLIEEKNSEELNSILDIIKAPGHWGVYASTGQHYTCAIFGRDSLRVAEDVIGINRELAEDIIITLAKLQGTAKNRNNEEEVGKIFHEFRAEKLDGIEADAGSKQILRSFQKKWQEEGSQQMIYYGSFDATPLFIRTVCNFVDSYGSKILDQSYIGKDGIHRSIRDSLVLATKWVVGKIENSPYGLLEYKRQNPKGIQNQVWKDSSTSYIYKDGTLPNFSKPITPIELQGFTYDALIMASKYIAKNDIQALYYRELAKKIQINTLDKLWLRKKGYFAQAFEYTEKGKLKKINTLTSDGAAVLNSGILEDLSPRQRNIMVKSIAEVVLSPDFLTPAGIRCRSLKNSDVPGFIDYQGSYSVWPKETYAIAKGFRRYGYNLIAQELEDLILQSILASGEFYEFFCVEADNTVWYDYKAEVVHFAGKSIGGDFQPPETGQSWTMSAFVRILSHRWINENANISNWEANIVKKISSLKSQAIKELILYA